MSCDLTKNPTRRSGFDPHILKANSKDLGSTSTSSSQIKTARVLIDGLGRNRLLRLPDVWRITEMPLNPNEDCVRLWASCAKVWDGVEGFPQSTRMEETKDEAAYEATMDWRRGMRDSE